LIGSTFAVFPHTMPPRIKITARTGYYAEQRALLDERVVERGALARALAKETRRRVVETTKAIMRLNAPEAMQTRSAMSHSALMRNVVQKALKKALQKDL
jgi:hypothetical protein